MMSFRNSYHADFWSNSTPENKWGIANLNGHPSKNEQRITKATSYT